MPYSFSFRLFVSIFLALVTTSASSKSVPILNSVGSDYVLTIPYLEHHATQETSLETSQEGSESKQQAYAATLTSHDLSDFSLSSVANTELSGDASHAPSTSLSQDGVQLKIPYLQVPNSSDIYSVNLSAPADLSLFSVDPLSIKTVFNRSELDFSNQLSLAAVSEQSIAGTLVGSSTKLGLSWTAPANYEVNHYEIAVQEKQTNREERTIVSDSTTTATLTGLKSDTTYSLSLYACIDPMCSEYAIAKSKTIKTAPEHWQLQGSGNSVAELTAPVADGNARISATRIGPDAGTANANTVQLYYGPFLQQDKNSTLTVASANVSASDSSSAYLEFNSLAYQAGLISPLANQAPPSMPVITKTNPLANDSSENDYSENDYSENDSSENNSSENNSSGNDSSENNSSENSASTNNKRNNPRADIDDFFYIQQVATGQGVAMTNGKVRLFFEANGSDNNTRIFWLDSQDGYLGKDFNSGIATTCSSAEEYSSIGSCAPTLAIGIDGDVSGSNDKINNARQQKIAFPTQTDWRWDMSAGTFMVFTTDTIDGCSDSHVNHAYAVWDGSSEWKVKYESDGCPKLFKSAQACLPIHLGGVRYKMYCGDPSQKSGKNSASSLPFLGPKQIIYADGTVSGDVGIVDFEDWESQTLVRDVVFIWPDGSQLNTTDEGYIDDYHFLAPTGDLDLQVMYMAITDGDTAPRAATAILLNP